MELVEVDVLLLAARAKGAKQMFILRLTAFPALFNRSMTLGQHKTPLVKDGKSVPILPLLPTHIATAHGPLLALAHPTLETSPRISLANRTHRLSRLLRPRPTLKSATTGPPLTGIPSLAPVMALPLNIPQQQLLDEIQVTALRLAIRTATLPTFCSAILVAPIRGKILATKVLIPLLPYMIFKVARPLPTRSVLTTSRLGIVRVFLIQTLPTPLQGETRKLSRINLIEKTLHYLKHSRCPLALAVLGRRPSPPNPVPPLFDKRPTLDPPEAPRPPLVPPRPLNLVAVCR